MRQSGLQVQTTVAPWRTRRLEADGPRHAGTAAQWHGGKAAQWHDGTTPATGGRGTWLGGKL